MQAALFYQYQTHTETAVRLCFFSQAECKNGIDELSEREQNLLLMQQFTGKLGDVAYLSSLEGTLSSVYIGIGEKSFTQAMAIAAGCLPEGVYYTDYPLPQPAYLYWALAQYRYTAFKKNTILAKRLVIRDEEHYTSISRDIDAIFLVRHLINAPANQLGPKELADEVERLALEHQAQFTQWVGAELEQGFPAIHSVGKASANVPRLLRLTWGDSKHPRIAIIGKGVCFDSGGLDIKPSIAMRLMKKDMGGAAHALGLAQWIMAHQLPICLDVFIPAVENAIGPVSFRPGDIITMRNGLSVEIDNTDAEGRLILADAITKACEHHPDLLIDFATLTGAARIAVGTEIAALFSNDDTVAADLSSVAFECNDPLWRLPLFAAYEGMLNSSVADVLNASPSVYAGAITAALFLQRFVAKDVPWLHFDIMAWNVSDKPGKPEGGEAMGMRAVAYYLKKKYAS